MVGEHRYIRSTCTWTCQLRRCEISEIGKSESLFLDVLVSRVLEFNDVGHKCSRLPIIVYGYSYVPKVARYVKKLYLE